MPNIRKPTTVHKLQGTYRASRHDERKNEPKSLGNIGRAPKRLTKEQALCWKEIVDITPDGVLAKSDRIIVELAARMTNDFRTNYEDFNAAKVSKLITILGKLGLNPSDRSSIVIEPPKSKEPSSWDDF